MNTKNNQRYKEMDACMKKAMLILMQEMDFDKITVKSICERAGVNRGTFYSHYADIFSMMDEIEEASSEELVSVTEEWCRQEENQQQSPFIPYLRHIKKHNYLYSCIFTNPQRFVPKNSFKPLWDRLVMPQCTEAGITDEYEIHCYEIYFQTGIFATLKYWLDTGCEKDELLISELLMNCVPNIHNLNSRSPLPTDNGQKVCRA